MEKNEVFFIGQYEHFVNIFRLFLQLNNLAVKYN